MEHQQFSADRDELRIRFTAWLKITVKRAKIDYIRHQKRHQKEISIEEVIDSDTLIYNLEDKSIGIEAKFDFENDQIALAFIKLPPKRRQVLTKLFVQNLTSQEVAEELCCSVEHVYRQRSLALKELKSILNKGKK